MLHSATGLSPAAARSKLVVEQATGALQAGDSGDAERLLRGHLLEQPQDAAALAKLAEIACEQRRFEEATVLLRRAASADPAPERRMALIRHLRLHAGPSAALMEIETMPTSLRNAFDLRAIEAGMLGILGIHDRQIAIYESLTHERPADPTLWMSLGNTYKTVGRLDDAIASIRRAIEVRPTFGEAWWDLANFKSYRFSDGDLAAMRKALKKKLSDEDALHFHFALGRALEDRHLYAQSFRHYAEGNRIRAAGFRREQMYATGFVDAKIATFTPEMFERHKGAGCRAPDPVFVIGLHRSGSTLIEQILDSHSLIEGTAELTIMPQIWDRLTRKAAATGRMVFQQLALLEPDELEAIGREYLDRARPFRLTDKPNFVDKLPANWMHLGLIRLALPNAKIIDARRHPMACGFSNFKQNYASGISFSYSLESIGQFYRDYKRLMDHIGRVQPGTVHRVLNERLIDDPEGETRALLDFIGVPFDAACLQSHRNTRAVMTPSAEQVRRPINRDGVDSWRPYEAWLGPLKQALGDALENWDKPSPAQ